MPAMDKIRGNGLTLGFSCVAHAYSHLFTLLYATIVLVLEREWHLSYAELIALSLPMNVMFGAAALAAGWAADRWGATPLMIVFYFGVGGGSILAGLASTPFAMLLALAVIGSFAAIYHPVGIPWLAKHAVNRGRAFGINGIFGSVGTAAAALIAGVLADYLGWRAAFFVPGAICLVTGLAFIAALRGGFIVEASEDVAPQPAPRAADVKRAFFVMSATMLCTGLMFQTLSVALPKIFDERLSGFLNDSIVGVGGMVTIVYAAGAIMQIVGGELADRFSLRTVYAAAQIVQVPLMALALVLYSPALVGVAAFLIGLNAVGQPAENALLTRYTPAKWRGRAFGAKFVLTLGVSTIGVALVPVIHRLTGSLDTLFIVLLGVAAIGGACTFLLPGEGRAKGASAGPVGSAAE